MKIEKPKKVDKVWGHELWIYNDEEYCGKLLVFEDAYSKFSMQKGHILTKKDFFFKSPAIGLRDKEAKLIVGKKVIKKIPKNKPIELKYFK